MNDLTLIQSLQVARCLEALMRDQRGRYSPPTPEDQRACADLAKQGLMMLDEGHTMSGRPVYRMTKEHVEAYRAFIGSEGLDA